MNEANSFRATSLPNGFILVRCMSSGTEALYDPETETWRYGTPWSVEPSITQALQAVAALRRAEAERLTSRR